MKRRKKTSAAMERQKPGNPRQTTFGSMMDGVQWEEKILSTADLFSGQPYQRPVKERVVDKLVREWDPRLLTPLVVSYRDGRYYLVDGQHRVCGGKKKNSGKDVDMLCQVYYGLTYEQEAELYYKLDQARVICGFPARPRLCWNPAATQRSWMCNGGLRTRALYGRWTSPPANLLRSRPPAPLSAPTTCWAALASPGCWA